MAASVFHHQLWPSWTNLPAVICSESSQQFIVIRTCDGMISSQKYLITRAFTVTETVPERYVLQGYSSPQSLKESFRPHIREDYDKKIILFSRMLCPPIRGAGSIVVVQATCEAHRRTVHDSVCAVPKFGCVHSWCSSHPRRAQTHLYYRVHPWTIVALLS